MTDRTKLNLTAISILLVLALLAGLTYWLNLKPITCLIGVLAPLIFSIIYGSVEVRLASKDPNFWP
jgi:hypothetical protein